MNFSVFISERLVSKVKQLSEYPINKFEYCDKKILIRRISGLMGVLETWLKEHSHLESLVWYDSFSGCFKALSNCFTTDSLSEREVAGKETSFVISPFSAGLPVLIFTGIPELLPVEKKTEQNLGLINTGILDDSGKLSYCSLVNAALQEIELGKIQKLVVSRVAETKLLKPFNPKLAADALNHLAEKHSNHFVWLWYRPNGTWHFGASPEFLLKFNRGELRTLSLAGTEKKSLINGSFSEKNKREQEWVTYFLKESFSQAGIQNIKSITESPLEFGDLAHIRTGISGAGSLSQAINLLANIQPTPATGGYPKEKALKWLFENESDRGYYAGFLGPVYSSGQFEFFVNLRSFTIEGEKLKMRVGAGIVAGSNPGEEYEETVKKIKATLSPLMKAEG